MKNTLRTRSSRSTFFCRSSKPCKVLLDPSRDWMRQGHPGTRMKHPSGPARGFGVNHYVVPCGSTSGSGGSSSKRSGGSFGGATDFAGTSFLRSPYTQSHLLDVAVWLKRHFEGGLNLLATDWGWRNVTPVTCYARKTKGIPGKGGWE